MNSHLLNGIVDNYCYQYICRGSPQWPDHELLNESMKTYINRFCYPLRELLNTRVSLTELSAAPEKFIPFLFHLVRLQENQSESLSENDIKPRSISALPRPKLHWRFITVNLQALTAFVGVGTRPSGYVDQLKLFYRVFDFHRLRYKR